MKTRLSVCLLLLAVLFACKKEKDEPAPDRRTLLTGRAWRLNQVLVNGVAITDPTQLALLGPLNGATVRFNDDGTLTATQAGGAVTNGTWAFGSTQDQLVATLGGQNYTFTILQLDTTQLVLTTPYTYLGITVTGELRMVPA
ncbi:MAG: hypothetical protein ICV83_03045 [Cytophagales bacterium]|nr:hypothetical protein [Cytophagales bacterium]